MTDKELRRLSRVELIRLLLEQTRESDRLRQELEETRQALEDRRILLSRAGSIAEASLQINGLMEAAQRAANQYMENVQRRYRESASKQYAALQEQMRALEAATREQCARMLEEAHRKAGSYGGDG